MAKHSPITHGITLAQNSEMAFSPKGKKGKGFFKGTQEPTVEAIEPVVEVVETIEVKEEVVAVEPAVVEPVIVEPVVIDPVIEEPVVVAPVVIEAPAVIENKAISGIDLSHLSNPFG